MKPITLDGATILAPTAMALAFAGNAQEPR
jgi:hypothetical protein